MSGPIGELRLQGRLVDASNGTFLAVDDEDAAWVYKPQAGEAPLRDFPRETLGRREVAAYAVSEKLGIGAVPETCWCVGPLGPGSVQRWITGEPTQLVGLLRPEAVTQVWRPIMLAEDPAGAPIVLAHRDDASLRRVALLDVLLNNADRKASHLINGGGQLWAVDHGLSLHDEPKLRTVLWGWAEEPFTPDEMSVLQAAAEVTQPLSPGLADLEWEALADRARQFLKVGTFPSPEGTWRDIPWPPM